MTQPGHPDIPGLIYQKDLGSGGFADVYLFRRTTPDRLVAVKVLRTTDMSDKLAKRFAAEANAMAALNHPHIAQVYSSGFTTDGRPYIEMAYYPAGSLDVQVRQEPLSVPDTLRIGVQLCSAVATAHGLDPPLLHRDIKPGNVLIDEYGDPVLTDFGIASHLNDQDDEDASLSVYWASPEAMFSTSPIDPLSDVYSLAALMWHLLVGRAPYVIPGGDNRPSPTMIRTRDLPVPSTGRPDVPAALERLLAQGMNKIPRLRPASAADLARALNAIEQSEYGFGRVTPFKVKMDATPAPETPAAPLDRTKLKSAPQVVKAQLEDAPKPAHDEDRRPDRQESLERGFTTVRPSVDEWGLTDVDDDYEVDDRGVKSGLIVALLVVALLIAGGVFWLTASLSGSVRVPPPSVSTSESPGTAVIGLELPPGPVAIECGRADDLVDCEWTYSNALTNDTFRVLLPDGSEQDTDQPRFQTTAPNEDSFCIRVKVVRYDGRFPSDWSDEGCAL